MAGIASVESLMASNVDSTFLKMRIDDGRNQKEGVVIQKLLLVEPSDVSRTSN
jgi:hypothetical protein